MPVMFLECPVDGMLPVEAPFINNTSLTMSMTESSFPCPVCHTQSPMIDMDLAPHDGVAELRPTAEQYTELRAAIEWAARAYETDAVSEREIVRRLSNTVREFDSSLLSRVAAAAGGSRSATLGTWIAVLVAVIALIVQLQPADSISLDDLERLWQLNEQHQDDRRSPRYPEFPMPAVPPLPQQEPPLPT